MNVLIWNIWQIHNISAGQSTPNMIERDVIQDKGSRAVQSDNNINFGIFFFCPLCFISLSEFIAFCMRRNVCNSICSWKAATHVPHRITVVLFASVVIYGDYIAQIYRKINVHVALFSPGCFFLPSSISTIFRVHNLLIYFYRCETDE